MLCMIIAMGILVKNKSPLNSVNINTHSMVYAMWLVVMLLMLCNA